MNLINNIKIVNMYNFIKNRVMKMNHDFKVFDIICLWNAWDDIILNNIGYVTAIDEKQDCVNVYFFDTQSHSSYHYSHLRKIEYKND